MPLSSNSTFPQPELIGYDAATERQLWLLKLEGIQTAFGWDELQGQKFVCLLAMDARSTPSDALFVFCSRLIDLGCAYFCAWGPNCELVHDIMDEQIVGDNPPVTYIGGLITTWHSKEPMMDAIEFFRFCTDPDEEFAPSGCPHGLVIAIGSTKWAAEVEQQLRQSMAAD